MTAPLQVRDLQLQAGQHGQVLLLQEGDPSPHTGHLLLQVALIHGSVSAQGCWEAEGRFLLQEDRFEKRSACMFNFASPLEPQRLARIHARFSIFYYVHFIKSIVSFTFTQIQVLLHNSCTSARRRAVAYRGWGGKIPIMCPRNAPVCPSLMQQ